MEQDNVTRLIELMKWSAEFYYDYHKTAEAQKTLHKIRRLQIDYYGLDSSEVLETEMEIFICTCSNLTSETSAKTSAAYKVLLGHLQDAGGPFRPTSSCLYGILGRALYGLDMRKEALETLKASVDLRSDVFGKETHFTVLARYKYLTIRSEIDPGSCTEELEQLYHHLDSMLSFNHPYLSHVRRELAIDLRNIGLKPQAVDLFKKGVTKNFPDYNEHQVAWKAHFLLAGSLHVCQLMNDASELFKEAYSISCKAFGLRHEITQCSAFAAGCSLYVLGSSKEAQEFFQQCNLPFPLVQELMVDMFKTEADPSSNDSNSAPEYIHLAASEAAAENKLSASNISHDRRQETRNANFESAIKLLKDFCYDDGFKLLMDTYRLQSQAQGHQDAFSVEILETICSWELCNEFVSNSILVEALMFLETLLPALRNALPAESITLQLAEWRYLDLMFKSDSSKGEQVASIALKTFEKLSTAINLSPVGTNNISTIFWEHANMMQKITKMELMRSIAQDCMNVVESVVCPRARMRYQELLGRSLVSTGNLREGLKDLLKLYKIECKSLKLNDPLLLSLLEGIHFSYTYFPGGNDKHVGFFRKAFETFKTPLGTEHSSTIVVQVLLASAMSSYPQAEPKLIKEGEELAQDAITKAIKIFGQNHWNTVKAKKSLVHILSRPVPGIAKKQTQDRLKRASDLMEETVETQADIFGLEHPFYLDACMEFCAMNIKFERFDAARKYAQIAVQGCSKKFGRHSRQAAEATKYLALIQLRMRR